MLSSWEAQRDEKEVSFSRKCKKEAEVIRQRKTILLNRKRRNCLTSLLKSSRGRSVSERPIVISVNGQSSLTFARDFHDNVFLRHHHSFSSISRVSEDCLSLSFSLTKSQSHAGKCHSRWFLQITCNVWVTKPGAPSRFHQSEVMTSTSNLWSQSICLSKLWWVLSQSQQNRRQYTKVVSK